MIPVRFYFHCFALVVLSGAVMASAAKPRLDANFFNGSDLSGWTAANMKYWSVKDGVITGYAEANVPRNEFLWSAVEVKDFLLVVDVRLTPANRNAGIQFRSKPANAHGQAVGYQADVGGGVWGKLYHEHGRGKLDWNNRADKIVKHGEWNRYEILAVGHRVWTALNGTLCVAIDDPQGEFAGRIALQIHSGPPQQVQYRIVKLVHDPAMELAGHKREELLAALPKPERRATAKPAPTVVAQALDSAAWNDEVRAWRTRLDAADPGLKSKWYARDLDAAGWKEMNLPRHYEGSGLPGHDGTVWFRRSVRLTPAQAGVDHTLNLGAIDDMDMTWVNGVQVGGIEVPGYWAKPRSYPVPAKLLRPGNNEIVVRVIDHGWSGGFAGSARQMKLSTAERSGISLHGPWRYRVGVTLKSLGLGSLTNPTRQPAAKAATLQVAPGEVPEIFWPIAIPKEPVPPFVDGFKIDRDQTIAIFGGSNAAECQRNGWLELRLISAHSKHRVQLRNLAMPADTVLHHPRPRNFFGQTNPGYGEKDGRKQMPVDVAVLWFGKMESLAGEKGLPAFRKAYEDFIKELTGYTRRIVLVTPTRFEDPLKLGFDLRARNANLEKYARVIRGLARERNLPLVDLTDALKNQRATKDGASLSEEGHRLAATAFARQLGFSEDQPQFSDYLRKAICEKNVVWSRYWLPSNWAFLYGNRQTQPSSRDHTNKSVRWFPAEVEKFRVQAEELEQAIADRLGSR